MEARYGRQVIYSCSHNENVPDEKTVKERGDSDRAIMELCNVNYFSVLLSDDGTAPVEHNIMPPSPTNCSLSIINCVIKIHQLSAQPIINTHDQE